MKNDRWIVLILILGLLIVACFTSLEDIMELDALKEEREQMYADLQEIKIEVSDLEQQMEDASESIETMSETYDMEKVQWIWDNRELFEGGQ